MRWSAGAACLSWFRASFLSRAQHDGKRFCEKENTQVLTVPSIHLCYHSRHRPKQMMIMTVWRLDMKPCIYAYECPQIWTCPTCSLELWKRTFQDARKEKQRRQTTTLPKEGPKRGSRASSNKQDQQEKILKMKCQASTA